MMNDFWTRVQLPPAPPNVWKGGKSLTYRLFFYLFFGCVLFVLKVGTKHALSKDILIWDLAIPLSDLKAT
ncbi:hypothetical protein VCRA2123E76_170006 [Vibrio crassostreae]|nr:hypothetical protein VCRA2123E76_170006 [Vibrio crassostreae]